MSDTEVRLKPGCSPKAIDEASVWLVVLRGPRRNGEVEQGFRRWRDQDPAHAAAFEAVTTMWELAEGLPRRALPLPQRWKRAGFRAGLARAAGAVAAVVVLMVAAVVWYVHGAGVTTGVGEQRTLTLRDGTRVYLNTNTRIVERYSSERRSVELKSGEALFEVAQHGPAWPFVVTAGTTQVTALGTAFVVRREDDLLSVTLMEGSVNVAPTRDAAVPAGMQSRVLQAGERVTFKSHQAPRMDRPEIGKVTAWRRGRVELDDTALADAAGEMNRYSDLKIRIERPESAAILVKGAFRMGDSASFARSVAATCGLVVRQEGEEIVLTGEPSLHCRE